MGKRFRDWIERILYVGMQPGQPAVRPERFKWLGPLKDPVERFLSGGQSNDPLYLTNRTPKQKMILAGGIAVPFLIVGVMIYLSASGYFSPSAPKVTNLTPAEIAQKMLPNLDAVHIQNASDLVVVEVHFNRGADPYVAGTLKNGTSHTIHSGEVVFDIANEKGSNVGRITASVENLAPQATSTFRYPLRDREGSFAIVREVTTR
jgi:hypothetical protein